MAVDRKQVRKVLFGGYYGQNNIGDDCFGLISVWGAKQFWGSEEIGLLSTVDIGQGAGVRNCLSGERRLWKQGAIEASWNILNYPAVVWSGGSIFHSRESAFSPIHLSTLLKGSGHGTVGAIGVSLGPYNSTEDEKYIHKLLRKLSFLSLRDKRSWEEAASLNLPFTPVLGADLAWLFPQSYPQENTIEDKPKKLGVCLCHYERYCGKDIKKEKTREELLLLALKRIVSDGYNGKIRFFIFNGHPTYGDKLLTQQFATDLKNRGASIEIIDYRPDPLFFWEKINECTACISIRLHGAIYSAAANVPCLLFEYHKKCSDLLDDLNLEASYRVGDVCLDEKELVEVIYKVLGQTESKYEFFPKRKKLMDLSLNNFKSVVF